MILRIASCCVGLALCAFCACRCRTDSNVAPLDGSPPLRIVSPEQRFSGTPEEIRVMIAGTGHEFQVQDVELVDGHAVDAHGKAFPVAIERHPGEASKYGPYILLRFDPSGGRQHIGLDAKIRYNHIVYAVSGTFLEGGPQDTYRWRGHGLQLKKEE